MFFTVICQGFRGCLGVNKRYCTEGLRFYEFGVFEEELTGEVSQDRKSMLANL
jgi:hypothetical protein